MPTRLINDQARYSKDLEKLSDGGERVFWRLIPSADDKGIFQADPELLVANCHPRRAGQMRPEKTARLLAEIEAAGIIRTYQVDGSRYGVFLKWAKFQRIRNIREKFPAPPDNYQESQQVPQSAIRRSESQQVTALIQSESESESESNPKKETRRASPSPDPKRSGSIEKIFSFWKWTMKHPNAKLTKEREKKIRERLKESYAEFDIIRAIGGCSSNPFNMGENPNDRKYDDITLICRTGSKLEGYRDQVEEEKVRGIFGIFQKESAEEYSPWPGPTEPVG